MKNVIFGMLFMVFIQSIYSQSNDKQIVIGPSEILDSLFVQKYIPVISYVRFDRERFNRCFSIENYYEENIISDSIIIKTHKNNFFKKRSISDSTYVFSCGRGDVDKIIDTLKCKNSYEKYFDWETEDFVVFTKGCGSNCWTNTIVYTSSQKDNLYISYSAVDKQKRNVVIIDDSNFVVLNLMSQKEVKIPIKNVACINGYPLFYIDNLKIKNKIISYTLKCEGKMKEEKITLKFLPSK